MQAQNRVQRLITDTEREWNVQFPEGSNYGIDFMAHTWEPLRF